MNEANSSISISFWTHFWTHFCVVKRLFLHHKQTPKWKKSVDVIAKQTIGHVFGRQLGRIPINVWKKRGVAYFRSVWLFNNNKNGPEIGHVWFRLSTSSQNGLVARPMTRHPFRTITSSLFLGLPGGYEFKGARVFGTSQSTFSVQKDVL